MLTDWELVGDKKECAGAEIFQNNFPTIGECAASCHGKSSMFAFGTNDYDLDMCDNTGNCPCYCYDGANDDGTCIQNHNNGFRLYRYEKNKNGKRFSLKLINYSQLSSIYNAH